MRYTSVFRSYLKLLTAAYIQTHKIFLCVVQVLKCVNLLLQHIMIRMTHEHQQY